MIQMRFFFVEFAVKMLKFVAIFDDRFLLKFRGYLMTVQLGVMTYL